MDTYQLIVLRGELDALESGFLADVLDAREVSEEADRLLGQHPNMPKEERAQAESLRLASQPTRGLVS